MFRPIYMEINTSANQNLSEIQPSDKGLLRITKVPFGDWKLLDLNPKKTPWIKEVLNEICDHYELEHDKAGKLVFNLQVLRKKDYELGDHLIIEGGMDLNYNATCIKCLEVFNEAVSADIDLCIASDHISKEEQYKDVTEVFCEEKERELYFYKRGQIDLSSLLRELVMLELNPLPIHDADCKGLCFECGTDLNHEQCSHSLSN